MIQLDFFDTSIVNNLVPVKTMKPDKIVFFIDHEDINSKMALHTKEAILKMVPGIEFAFVGVDSSSIYDIHDKIYGVVKEIDENEEVYMDLTGGNALMAVSAHRIRREYRKIILMYADLNKGVIYEIHSLDVIKNIENLTLEDYMNARGAKHIRNSHHNPEVHEYDRIIEMAEFLFDHLEDWKYLQQQIQKKSIYEVLLINEHQIDNEEGADVTSIINKFVELGFLTDRGNGYYNYGNSRYKEYVRTFGIWLELYIYIKALQYFDENKVGYMIDWNAADDVIDPSNEIDVVVMKNSIPYFISCKMKKPSIYDGYEVGFLANQFGKELAKGIIATTYCADEYDHNYSLERRFAELNIGLIKTCQFKEESLEAIFEKAICPRKQ